MLKYYQFLKDHSKDAHISSEKVIINQIKSIKDKEAYLIFLNKFRAFFEYVEKSTADYLESENLGCSFEKCSANIKDDILALGGSSSIEISHQFPKINNSLEALIGQYILQGSSFGKSHIGKMLQKTGVISSSHYFNDQITTNMQNWPKFIEFLDSKMDNGNHLVAVEFSNKMFLSLQRLFQEN